MKKTLIGVYAVITAALLAWGSYVERLTSGRDESGNVVLFPHVVSAAE